MFIIEAIIIPLFIVLFNFKNITGLSGLVVIVLLGTVGFIVVGTLFSALTVNMRTREILLPVILFPIIIPLIMSAVMGTRKVLMDGSIMSAVNEIRILVVYDIVFLIASLLVFEYIIED